MDYKFWFCLLTCIIGSIIIGYSIGKKSIKPKGDIVFEAYYDEEEQSERLSCVFKLDLDIEQIINENVILFRVEKDQKVLDLYKNS